MAGARTGKGEGKIGSARNAWGEGYYPLTNRARGPYWGILARGRGSTELAALGPYENDRGPIFPGTARASSVSK